MVDASGPSRPAARPPSRPAAAVDASVERVERKRKVAEHRLAAWRNYVLLVLAFLIVFLFFGLGFALHVLWILAVIFFALWLVGFAVGRGERAGRHRFYRW
jgi:uncharacterized membrane protein